MVDEAPPHGPCARVPEVRPPEIHGGDNQPAVRQLLGARFAAVRDAWKMQPPCSQTAIERAECCILRSMRDALPCNGTHLAALDAVALRQNSCWICWVLQPKEHGRYSSSAITTVWLHWLHCCILGCSCPVIKHQIGRAGCCSLGRTVKVAVPRESH